MVASLTSLPTLMSAPPFFFKCGSAALQPLKTPQTFVSYRRLASSRLVSSNRP